MALYPLISNFQHDFVLQLLAVDTENTMDEVAAAAAHHSVGRRVTPQPGKVIRVPASPQLSDVVRSLNALGATPQDLLAILQAIKAAGALNAELEVI